jgi:hypothetical protein
MRMLTMRLTEGSVTPMVNGDERNLADSGELLQKGIPKFVALQTLLHAVILPNDLRD